MLIKGRLCLKCYEVIEGDIIGFVAKSTPYLTVIYVFRKKCFAILAPVLIYDRVLVKTHSYHLRELYMNC